MRTYGPFGMRARPSTSKRNINLKIGSAASRTTRNTGLAWRPTGSMSAPGMSPPTSKRIASQWESRLNSSVAVSPAVCSTPQPWLRLRSEARPLSGLGNPTQNRPPGFKAARAAAKSCSRVARSGAKSCTTSADSPSGGATAPKDSA